MPQTPQKRMEPNAVKIANTYKSLSAALMEEEKQLKSNHLVPKDCS